MKSLGNVYGGINTEAGIHTVQAIQRLHKQVDTIDKTLSTISRNAELINPRDADTTATIGLTRINGIATTFMRSDAAPPLSQAIVPTWTGIHTFSVQDVHNAGISLGTSGIINSAEPDGGGQPSFLLQPSVSHTTDPLFQLKDFAGNVKLEYLAGGEMGVQGNATAGQLLSFSTTTAIVPTLRMGIASYIQLNAGSPTAFSALSGTANIAISTVTPSGAPAGMVGHVAVQANTLAGNPNLSAFMSAGLWGGANITSAANAPSPANVAVNMRGNLARVSSVHGAFFAPNTASGGTNRPWVSVGLTGDIPAYTHQSGSQAGIDIISTSSSAMVGSNASDAIQAFGGRFAFPTGRTTGTQRKGHLTFHHRGTGIGTITSSGTALTGVGTQFLTQLIASATITIPNAAGSATARTATVASITNNTAAVLNAGFTGSDATLATPFEYTYAAIGAGGPGGNAVGDVYFDLGTNNPIGLAEHDGTAWRYLLHPASLASGAAGAGNWGPITGLWKFNAMDDVTSNTAVTTWLFTSNRSDAGTPPDAFNFKASSTDIADHTAFLNSSSAKILEITANGDLTTAVDSVGWTFTSNRKDSVGVPNGFEFRTAGAQVDLTNHTRWRNVAFTTLMTLGKTGNLSNAGTFTCASTLTVTSGGASFTGTVTESAVQMNDSGAPATVATGTTNGTKIGTSVSQLLAFWNSSPIVQPANSTPIDTLLTSTGLRATGGTANFDTALTPSTNGGVALGANNFGFSSLILKDTAAAFEVTSQFTCTGIAADRTLTTNLGNASRTVVLSGNPTLADWFDQDVKTTGTPQHARLGVGQAADGTVLLAVNDAVAAPSTTATPVFTAYYGGNTNALGDPNAWLRVRVGGTTYKLPLYT